MLQLSIGYDRNQVYAACGDGRIRGYDLATGAATLEWTPPSGRSRKGARCVAAAGDLLAAGFADGYVRVFDRRAGHWAAAAGEKLHDDYVNDIAYDSRYSRVCTASDDGRLGVLEVGRTGPDGGAAVRRAKSIWVGRPVNTVAFDHSSVGTPPITPSLVCALCPLHTLSIPPHAHAH